MKFLYSILKLPIFLVLIFGLISCEKQNTIHVVLVGGQSNATGQGYIKNLPEGFKTDSSVLFFYSKYLNGLREKETWVPLSNASENAGKFGPELGLGNELARLKPGENIAFIKHALSGSNLFSQWNPGESPADSANFGPEFKKFVDTVNKGMEALKEQGYTPVIKAMTWQQGEADARDNAGMEVSRAYEENLQHFIRRVREQFQVPEMIFVYGYVIPVPLPRFTGREEVREAQRNIDANSGNTASVEKAFVVETDDLPLRSTEPNSPHPEDVVHFNTLGMLELGKRYAIKINENW